MVLSEIKNNEECLIVKINGQGDFHNKVMSLGFVPGEIVRVVKNAPLCDPIEYVVMNSHVSLRRDESEKIEVVPSNDKAAMEKLASKYPYYGTISDSLSVERNPDEKEITVALVGNPNCGKTSLFNHATGMKEKVGNYSGVTVSAKTGTFKHKGYLIKMVDLPGTYSVAENSPEEQYVRDYLLEIRPDVVLNVVDSTNLERNLFLTTQVMDMKLHIVMALNMYDELQSSGTHIDVAELERQLGVECTTTVAKSGDGIISLLDSIVAAFKSKEHTVLRVNYGEKVENAILQVRKELEGYKDISNHPIRFLAVKLLENEPATINHLSSHTDNFEQIKKVADLQRSIIEKDYNEDFASVITNSKFAFIRGVIDKVISQTVKKDNEKAYLIDKVLTHKWLGYPILILFLWIMFQTTFTLGAYPQDWIDAGISWFGSQVATWMGDGILTSLIVDGIIAGVGGVLVFLPNIIILFLFISLFEDTGYMARAAFMMDKLMHKIGLHGKSFIPMLTGFGCSVPAVMATRTLEKPKDRLATMMAIPFVSCSARLPVYLLFVAAFFQKNQGLIILSIYLIGILISILTALLLKNTKFKGESEQFVMELPPYRVPSTRNVLVHMWDKSVQYLKKMGSVILVASIIIWLLNYFPTTNSKMEAIDKQIAQTEQSVNIDEESKLEIIAQLEIDKAAAQSEYSYIGRIGKFIAPVVQPLGFDWQMGVSLLTGLAAKEIIVSSMGILYNADTEADENSEKLTTALQTHLGPDGKPFLTPLKAYVYMIFVLLCFPCVAAISAIAKEANWRWAGFTMIYTTSIAWIISFLVYQIGLLFI